MKCEICEKENYVIDTSKFPAKFCSYKCYEEWQKFNKPSNCECSVCGIKMYLKPSRLKRVKNDITCSINCASRLKSSYMKGEGNHQFGLKGELNDSYKGSEIFHHEYIYEYCPNHPKCNNNGRIRQHRLIIEKNYKLFDNKYFELINNFYILKDIYDVHHINEIKSDNNLENLQILTRSEHTLLHNSISGVLKQGELLENPEEDNQQPSLNSNVFEGSTTNSRIQTSNVEDGNANTSALPSTVL